MRKYLLPILILALLAIAAIGYALTRKSGDLRIPIEPNPISPRPCTEEAKLCPDGSAVGRTGPNCEFAKCP